MTPHLSPDEFVDGAEGALDAARVAHVETCASCAAEIAALQALLREVAAPDDVPEPSPLFWDHWRRRVKAAAASAPPASWWSRLTWRPFVAISAAAAVVALMLVARPFSPPPAAPETAVAEVAPADTWLPALEDGSFDIVLELASELEWDDVRQVATPRAGTVDALIQELSPAERQQLVALLKTEIGELE